MNTNLISENIPQTAVLARIALEKRRDIHRNEHYSYVQDLCEYDCEFCLLKDRCPTNIVEDEAPNMVNTFPIDSNYQFVIILKGYPQKVEVPLYYEMPDIVESSVSGEENTFRELIEDVADVESYDLDVHLSPPAMQTRKIKVKLRSIGKNVPKLRFDSAWD